MKVVPHTQGEAIRAFIDMAVKDTGPLSGRPSRAALNPRAPKAMPIRVYIDLAEPDGKQDHCLFKDEDEAGRRIHVGERRPEDYMPDRAERIRFIPEVLLKPDWVFKEKAKPNNWIYACRTGIDEYYIVVVDVREKKRQIDCDLLSAYHVTQSGWDAKLKRWTKIFSKKEGPRKSEGQQSFSLGIAGAVPRSAWILPPTLASVKVGGGSPVPVRFHKLSEGRYASKLYRLLPPVSPFSVVVRTRWSNVYGVNQHQL